MASEQSKVLNELKSTTEPGECVVLCGFAENYPLFCKMKLEATTG
jgi:hypothetical protein